MNFVKMYVVEWYNSNTTLILNTPFIGDSGMAYISTYIYSMKLFFSSWLLLDQSGQLDTGVSTVLP